jgi:biotin carboxylase
MPGTTVQDRALLLVHRGSRLTAPLVKILRDKGFEPFVLSSVPFDDGAPFRAVCEELGVEHDISTSPVLTADEVLERARTVPDCRFCFSFWDGQRSVMAQANELLGAHDITPAAARSALDKHLMRAVLVERGLSRLHPFRLDDPRLRERLDRGERHIVKPRRGAGSLCTRSVTSWAEVQAQVAAFGRGPGEADLLAEYYHDNELVAETFFAGREVSFEVIRQGGRTLLASDHERTVLDFAGETVLERGFASPPVYLGADDVDAARALSDRALDALGLADGCYHVEVSVGAGGGCEIIEVNPRLGGQYMFDSVRLQHDRSLIDDWLDVLAGRPVPPAGERTCGTYYQAHYLEPSRQVLGSVRNRDMPEPEMYSETFKPGSVARADREELGAMTIWKTDLADHNSAVAALMPEEYCSFVYARGLTGRPLFLVLEPTNHIYWVIAAADRKGYDVVVFHTLPILDTGPYAVGRDGIALSHLLPSWDDVDTWFAAVLGVCAGREVAGTYAAQEIALELEARVQEHFGLPSKGSAVVRELLDKVNVRRRLVGAGLSKLRVFEQGEVDGLRSWPTGDRALYFKPVHGAGSAFVRRCRNLEEVRAAIAEWKAAEKGGIPVLGPYLESEGGHFFLEEEAPGELLSIEGYVHRGSYHAVGLSSRAVLERDRAVEMGSTFPYEHPRRDEVAAKAALIHEVLGVAHGFTHTEFVVPDEGDIELVELNLRFIGADALASMNAACGVRVEDDLVALAVGELPRPLVPSRFAGAYYLLPPSGLRRIESLELPDADLPFVKIVKPAGSELASTDRQIDWIGSYAVSGPTFDETVRRAIDVRRRTLVNGIPLGDDPNNVVTAR